MAVAAAVAAAAVAVAAAVVAAAVEAAAAVAAAVVAAAAVAAAVVAAVAVAAAVAAAAATVAAAALAAAATATAAVEAGGGGGGDGGGGGGGGDGGGEGGGGCGDGGVGAGDGRGGSGGGAEVVGAEASPPPPHAVTTADANSALPPLIRRRRPLLTPVSFADELDLLFFMVIRKAHSVEDWQTVYNGAAYSIVCQLFRLFHYKQVSKPTKSSTGSRSRRAASTRPTRCCRLQYRTIELESDVIASPSRRKSLERTRAQGRQGASQVEHRAACRMHVLAAGRVAFRRQRAHHARRARRPGQPPQPKVEACGIGKVATARLCISHAGGTPAGPSGRYRPEGCASTPRLHLPWRREQRSRRLDDR